MNTHTFFAQHSLIRRPLASWLRRGLIVSLMIIVLMSASSLILLHNQSDVVAQIVDVVRNLVGPRSVAIVEETVFGVEDWFNRTAYQVTGNSSPGWQLVAPVQQATTRPGVSGFNPSKPAIAQVADNQPNLNISASPGEIATSVIDQSVAPTFTPPSSLTPIITNQTLPGEGQWQPLATAGQPADEPPMLWTTSIRPDPSRPYVQVALVAMDLSRSRLHLMIGAKEPESPQTKIAPRPGMIPADVQSSGTLLAAWNGGFKAIHGHYGMMSDGVTWLPAEPGMATLAIKRDGQVIIGAWGRGVTSAMDLVAWRQNNPPLIENGVVNPDVHATTNLKEWGITIGNKAVTWRSGLGLTQDGHWLIYAAGNSLSTETLTTALQAAGAYNAMQTDINNPYDRFDTYTASAQQEQVNNQPVTLPLTAQRLIDQMKGGPDQFLVPYDRDFFYLTSQATPASNPAPAPSLLALWRSVGGSNQLISLKQKAY